MGLLIYRIPFTTESASFRSLLDAAETTEASLASSGHNCAGSDYCTNVMQATDGIPDRWCE
jgi:hypothetical protein